MPNLIGKNQKENMKENMKGNIRTLPCFTFINSGTCPYPKCQFIHDDRLSIKLNPIEIKKNKSKKIDNTIISPEKLKKCKVISKDFKEDIFYYPQQKRSSPVSSEYNIDNDTIERQMWDRFVGDITNLKDNKELGKEINEKRLPVFIQCEKGIYSTY